jgi:nucleoside recognition membrane protein YjiH
MSPIVRLWLSAVLGLGFFAIPIPWGDRWTVVFDVVVRELRTGFSDGVAIYCTALILFGATATGLAALQPGERPRLKPFEASPALVVLRIAGAS